LTRGAGGVAVTAGAKGVNVETEGVGRAAAGAVSAGAESGAGCGVVFAGVGGTESGGCVRQSAHVFPCWQDYCRGASSAVAGNWCPENN